MKTMSKKVDKYYRVCFNINRLSLYHSKNSAHNKILSRKAYRIRILQRYLTITEDRYQDYVDFEEVNESLFQRIKQLYKSKAAKVFRICEFISYHPLHYSKYSEEDWDSVNKFNYIKTAKTKMDQDLNNLSNFLNY